MFWLTSGILGWLIGGSLLMAFFLMGVILVSILVHEWGHALTAKAFGQQAEISLVAMGGLTHHDGKQLKRWQDFLVVLMGPIAGLLLAGAAFILMLVVSAIVPPLVNYILKIFVQINIFWTLINLLPILPLDGGQLLRIILEGIFGHKGLKATLMIGVILAVGIGATAFVFGYFLVGAILLLLAFEGFTSWNQIRSMTENDQDRGVQQMLQEAQGELHLGRFESAKEKFEALRQKTQKGLIYDAVSEQLAFLYDKDKDLARVYEILKTVGKNLSIQGRCLLHRAAYSQKDYKLTLSLGNRCFRDTQACEIAYINAAASASIKDVKACIGWLQCALKHGMPDLENAVSKSEFDPIRDQESFKNFISSH